MEVPYWHTDKLASDRKLATMTAEDVIKNKFLCGTVCFWYDVDASNPDKLLQAAKKYMICKFYDRLASV